MAFVIEDAPSGTVDISPDIKDMAQRYGATAPTGGYVIEDADPRSELTKAVNTGARATETVGAKILSGVAGAPGDFSALAGWLGKKAGFPEVPDSGNFGGFPTSADVMGQFAKIAPPYEPTSKLGQYADRAAVGAGSAAILGGATLPSIIAGVGGGVGSKLGHDMFPDKPIAEIIGGVLGGGGTGGLYSWLRKSPSAVAREAFKGARTPIDDAIALQSDSNRLGLGPLTAGESMNSQPLLAVQRLLEQSPQGNLTRAQMNLRGPRAASFSNAQVEGFAPGVTPRMGADAVQDGASGALKAVRDERGMLGSPLYKSSFEGARPIGVDPTPVFNIIKEIGDGNPAVRPVLDKLARTVMRDRYGRPITDIEQLQNGIKVGLSDAQGVAVKAGQNGLAKALGETQEKLLGVLDTASPEFANARAVWRQLSEPVNEAEKSLIGNLVNDTKTFDAKNRPLSESAKIFINPKNETPADITRAAKAISDVNPQAVPALVKQYLSDKLEAAKGAVVADTSRLGANFNQRTMGATELEPRQAANIEAAIRAMPDGAKVWNGFERVMAVYRAQGNRYVPGSPTAYNTAVEGALKSNGGFGPGGILEAVSNPFRWIGDRIQNARLSGTYSILDRVLSSPDSIEQLRAIAREPSRRRVQVMVGTFMGDQPARAVNSQPTPQP